MHCVLELVEQDVSFEQIVQRFYPELAVDDVRVCVSYASRHRVRRFVPPTR